MSFQDELGKLHRAFTFDVNRYPDGFSSDITVISELYFSSLAPFVGGTIDNTYTGVATTKKDVTVPGESTPRTVYYFSGDRTWRDGDAGTAAAPTSNILGTFGGVS